MKVLEGNERVLVNLHEAAQMLGVAAGTLKAWSLRGRVPVVRLGRRRLFPKELLLAWIERHTVDEKQPAEPATTTATPVQPEKDGA